MGAFSLGRVVATPAALELVGWAGAYALLTRHVNNDWGDLEAFDRRQNTRALETGARLFSAYETPSGRVWIITEADRSSTCVLTPSEY
jgi:hypothetical protein